jgi:acyl-CoA synthetase (AMP-forming)/AMP-acid ligase II
VAVLLDNSIEAVFSIFGILKAGGVFSTLSPTLKPKKLEFILNNLEALFLVTHKISWRLFQLLLIIHLL